MSVYTVDQLDIFLIHSSLSHSPFGGSCMKSLGQLLQIVEGFVACDRLLLDAWLPHQQGSTVQEMSVRAFFFT